MENENKEIDNSILLLAEIIDNFYQNKISADHFKKLCDDYNSTIKKMFMEMNIKEFETGNGLVAKLTIQKRESFKEDELIKRLTEMGHDEIIDLVPKINYDKLEDAIYNGRINASELAEFKTVKEIPTLKVSLKK